MPDYARGGPKLAFAGRLTEVRPTSLVETWGTFPQERAELFPCDDLIERPDGVLFRGVDIAAPPEVVFRWICQLRVAPYSYDWIDNLGRKSPRQLVPGLDELEVGQRFMTIFRLVSFQVRRSITIESSTAGFGRVAVTYSLMAVDAQRCRLVAKVAFQSPKGLLGLIMRRLLPAGDLIMMRKQLLTLKAMSERAK
jgi:hypothetical protein